MHISMLTRRLTRQSVATGRDTGEAGKLSWTRRHYVLSVKNKDEPVSELLYPASFLLRAESSLIVMVCD